MTAEEWLDPLHEPLPHEETLHCFNDGDSGVIIRVTMMNNEDALVEFAMHNLSTEQAMRLLLRAVDDLAEHEGIG